jgi:hypothetical protein
MSILVGADPELFVTNAGEVVSAHELVPGDKKNPYKVHKGAVQVDGTALEFNIDPAATEDEFVTNVQTVMRQLRDMVPTNYEFLLEPSVLFSDSTWGTIPESAKQLGCDPDYSAWFMAMNMPPPVNKPMRTASGHVHLGVGKLDFDAAGALAREMDYYLGIFTLDYDKDESRRSMYGKAGAFREKPYGIEYRTPSNAWLRSESIMRRVYRHTHLCASNFLKSGSMMCDLYDGLAQDIINEGQRDWRIRYPALTESLSKAGLDLALVA